MHAETTITAAATVPLELDHELADGLVVFATDQGLIFDEDSSQQERVSDAIAFVLGLAEGQATLRELSLLAAEHGVCRSCGCSDIHACVRTHPDGVHEHASGARYDVCRWAEPDLCSACTPGAHPGWLHPADQQEAAAA